MRRHSEKIGKHFQGLPAPAPQLVCGTKFREGFALSEQRSLGRGPELCLLSDAQVMEVQPQAHRLWWLQQFQCPFLSVTHYLKQAELSNPHLCLPRQVTGDKGIQTLNG